MMRVINETVELVPVRALKVHPRNPRQGDVGAIHESIRANGFYGVIVAQRSTGYILAGNHRYMAALHAGAEEVPVAWVDVDDDAALRILLADNRTNDLASYDTATLTELLQEILDRTGSLEGTGYDGDALDELLRDQGASDTENDGSAVWQNRFEVVVSCENEQQQEELYARLTAEGYVCRVLTL